MRLRVDAQRLQRMREEKQRRMDAIAILEAFLRINGERRELAEVPMDVFDRVMAVNVKGIVNLTEACAEGLRQTRGAVVNVASITTLVATRARRENPWSSSSQSRSASTRWSCQLPRQKIQSASHRRRGWRVR